MINTFSVVPSLVQFVFILVAAVFVFVIGKAIITAVNNVGQPLLDRPARIVAKRQRTSVSGGMNDLPATSSNHYYVTFEFGDGSREELSVRGSEYGMLVEGDAGVLHSQGTWYKGFDRMAG